jgi:hypothetical protein
MAKINRLQEKMLSIDLTPHLVPIKVIFGRLLSETNLGQYFDFESMMKDDHFWQNQLLVETPGWGIWDNNIKNNYRNGCKPIVDISQYGYLYVKVEDGIGRVYFESTMSSSKIANKEEYESWLIQELKNRNLYDKDFNLIRVSNDALLEVSPKAEHFIYHFLKGYFSILLSAHSSFQNKYPVSFDLTEYILLYLKRSDIKVDIDIEALNSVNTLHELNQTLEEIWTNIVDTLQLLYGSDWGWQLYYLADHLGKGGVPGEFRINLVSQGDFRILDWMEKHGKEYRKDYFR